MQAAQNHREPELYWQEHQIRLSVVFQNLNLGKIIKFFMKRNNKGGKFSPVVAGFPNNPVDGWLVVAPKPPKPVVPVVPNADVCGWVLPNNDGCCCCCCGCACPNGVAAPNPVVC